MDIIPTRRHVLLTAGLSAVVIGSGTLAPQLALADPEVSSAQLIARRRELLIGDDAVNSAPLLDTKRDAEDEVVTALRSRLVRGADRPGIWEDASLAQLGTAAAGADNLQTSFERLYAMTLAWASPWSTHHDDADLLAEVVDGLTFLAPRYDPKVKRVGNWYKYEIGSPKNIVGILVLLGDGAPAAVRSALLAHARAHAPNPNLRTGMSVKEAGANRSDKALMTATLGLLTENPDDVRLGRDAVLDVSGGGANSLLRLVTRGDGFSADGSFVQHDYLPYSGSYGMVALTGIADVVGLLDGSAWAFSAEELQDIVPVVEKTFVPFQWDARAMDTTRGRQVSRQWDTDHNSGIAILSAIERFGAAVPNAESERWTGIIKGMLDRTTDRTLVDARLSVAFSGRLLAIQGSSTAAAPLKGTFHTVAQQRMVHHRGDWAAVVSTSSVRIGRYEWGNSQNRAGWKQGEGVLYLYHRKDSGQFSDDFWPTVDPLRLPGITVNGEPTAKPAGQGTAIPRATAKYAGGALLGTDRGTTAMYLANDSKKLTAHKSWFHLEDSVVCIGSNIQDTSGTGARTIVENRSFPTGKVPKLTVDGKARTVKPGADPIDVTGWVHVPDHAAFVLLRPEGLGAQAPARLAVTRRTGSWWDIDQGGGSAGDKEVRTRDFLGIERAHGPSGDHYAYQVLPLADARTAAAAADRPTVRVLVADDVCHMIETRPSGKAPARMMHFFAAATLAGVTVSGPCCVTYQLDPSGVRVTEVAVSQPNHAGGRVTVTLPVPARTTVARPDGRVTIRAASPLTLDVDMADDRGQQRTVGFAATAR